MGVLIPDLDFFWNDPPSLAVRIPKAIADALKVSIGKRAEMRSKTEHWCCAPILKPARKPRCTLDELLNGIVPKEVEWQRGNEAW